jgi:hypothetical protein
VPQNPVVVEQIQTIATLDAQPDFRWEVGVLQNGQGVAAQNGEYALQRAPFTLQVKIFRPVIVRLNVWDRDTHFAGVQPGLAADDGCASAYHPFCDLLVMAVADEPEYLVIDDEQGLAVHVFSVSADTGQMGNVITVTPDGIEFERHVSQLRFVGAETRDVPIEQFSGQRLYLTFLAKYQPDNAIAEDELRRMILSFP